MRMSLGMGRRSASVREAGGCETEAVEASNEAPRHALFTLRRAAVLAAWLGLCFLASSTGAFVEIGGWYAGLAKPSWNPPGWLFGPVWTLLYAMMGFAAWLVWSEGGWARQKQPLGWFLVQLALNALWTPLFFGAHLLGWAFVEICLLAVAIGVTQRLFRRVHRAAAALLLPYLGWVVFAAVLNFTLWRMNR